jgi:hypothetical protein
MEDFYFYTIVIALIILIGMLTMIGIILSYGNETKVYPPVQNDCPDYWIQATNADVIVGNTRTGQSTIAGDYCKFPSNNGTNRGSDDITTAANWVDVSNSIGGNFVSGTYYVQMKGNDSKWGNLYPGMTVRCAKQKWALDRGIVWDGVTNYNGCTVKIDETKRTKATITPASK